jgi:hypothetical protein
MAGKRKKIGSWGGKRTGAGRQRENPFSLRRLIATKYFEQMREDGSRPHREAVIRKLAIEHTKTPRMIERCIAEFLPDLRREHDLWTYAIKGMNQILPLPSGRLRKLKPGVYIDPTYKDLRLVVGDSGDRKWIFRYVLGTTMFKDIQLGDSKMSHDEARRSAREQRRILASGKDPAKS